MAGTVSHTLERRRGSPRGPWQSRAAATPRLDVHRQEDRIRRDHVQLADWVGSRWRCPHQTTTNDEACESSEPCHGVLSFSRVSVLSVRIEHDGGPRCSDVIDQRRFVASDRNDWANSRPCTLLPLAGKDKRRAPAGECRRGGRCATVRTGVRMPLRLVAVSPLFIALAAISAPHAALIAQPSAPTIAGAWVLNPGLTQRPEEIGFTPEWARAQGTGGEGGERSGGGRGGSGSGGGAMGVPASSRESLDDSTRVQQLTGDARIPPSRLTIIQKDTAIAIADDQGHAPHVPSRRASRGTDDRHRAAAHYCTVGWGQPRRGLRRRERPPAALHIHAVGRSHAVASEHSVP